MFLLHKKIHDTAYLIVFCFVQPMGVLNLCLNVVGRANNSLETLLYRGRALLFIASFAVSNNCFHLPSSTSFPELLFGTCESKQRRNLGTRLLITCVFKLTEVRTVTVLKKILINFEQQSVR